MSPVPETVLEEIKRHDINGFKILSLEHESVTMAVAYLMQAGWNEMARALRQLAADARLRMGPLEGIVACAAEIPSQGEFILLSNQYAAYLTELEIMGSLVHEIGAFDRYHLKMEDHQSRCDKAMAWMLRLKEGRNQTSVIAVAAKKKSENN